MATEHKMVLTAELKDRLTKKIQTIQKEIKQLDATAKRGDFGKAYERAGKQIQLAKAQFQQFAHAHGEKIKKMTKDIAKWGAGITAGLVYGIKNLSDQAKNLEQTRNTFNRLTSSIGASRGALERMRNATQGMVSDAQLMEAGNKLISMGLANSGAEMEKLTQIASKLGTAMGNDATASLENFSLMLANQSILRLDSFGISSGKVRERIAELTQGVNAMDRETAFMTATMEQAEASMKKLGDAPLTAGQRMQQAQASIENMKNEIAERMIPVMADLYKSIMPVVKSISKWINDNRELFTTLATFTVKALATVTVVAGLGVAIGKLTVAYAGLKAVVTGNMFKGLLKSIGGVILGMKGATGTAFTLTGGIAGLKTAMAGASRTALAFMASLAPILPIILAVGVAVGGAIMLYRDWTSTSRNLAEAQKRVAEKQQEVTDKFGDLQTAVGSASSALADHKDKMASYSKQLQQVKKEQSKLAESFNQQKGDAKTELAKKFVEAEEKAKNLTVEITDKQEQIRAELSKKTQKEITKTQIKAINERVEKMREEIAEKKAQKKKELEALELESGARKLVENEIAEVKRRNSLTELQRAVEDYNKKIQMINKAHAERRQALVQRERDIGVSMDREEARWKVQEKEKRKEQIRTFMEWMQLQREKMELMGDEEEARRLDERFNKMNIAEKTLDVYVNAQKKVLKFGTGLIPFAGNHIAKSIPQTSREKFIEQNKVDTQKKINHYGKIEMSIVQNIAKGNENLSTDIINDLKKKMATDLN